MAKDRRSFFERLSGAVKVEDDLSQDLPESHGPARHLSVKGGRAVPQEPAEDAWANEEQEGQLTVDVFQTPDEIVIKTMTAGVRPEDLDISITRDMVTIRGKREENQSAQGDDYFIRELYWGTFSRTISLPQEVEVEEAEASEKNGLITIRLPKIDKHRETKLRIKSS